MAKGYLYDNGDELITREDVNEVPDSSTAHAGDVLELDSNKKPKWTTPESGLPDTSEASVGDVLTLDSDKDPVWSAPSGGGNNVIYVTVYNVSTEYRAYFFDREGNQVSLSEIKEMDDTSPVFFVLPELSSPVSSWDEVEMDNFTGTLSIDTQVYDGVTYLYFDIGDNTYSVNSDTWTGTNTYIIGSGQQ